MKKQTIRLGRIQLRIMETLWQRGQASAREITDVLAPDEKLAHSTVQTLLRKLEDKGAVDHVQEGRTFLFRPKIERGDVDTSAVRDLLVRVFDGSVSGLVAHLLKSEDVAPAEIARLKELIRAHEEAEK